MLSFPAAIKVYLCTLPCDMRRSFDGLSMMAEHILRCDPFSGHLLVFCNKRSDRLKILYWDRDGFALWSKRLEEGTYVVPFEDGARERRREITAQELGALLSGIDLDRTQAQQWWRAAECVERVAAGRRKEFTRRSEVPMPKAQ